MVQYLTSERADAELGGGLELSLRAFLPPEPIVGIRTWELVEDSLGDTFGEEVIDDHVREGLRLVIALRVALGDV